MGFQERNFHLLFCSMILKFQNHLFQDEFQVEKHRNLLILATKLSSKSTFPGFKSKCKIGPLQCL